MKITNFFWHFLLSKIFIIFLVIIVKVKVFDESHEKDLEKSVNEFLQSTDSEIIDIKYQVAIAVSGEEQIYCFSALVCYYD